MASELSPAIWWHILGQLTFREASQAARTCRSWNQELQQRTLVDLRNCHHIFAARHCLCRHRDGQSEAQLILPASHSAQQVLGEVMWGYGKVQLLGLGLALESLATSIPFNLVIMQHLQHIELHNMAFVNYTQAPHGDMEDWYTFDVGCLAEVELKCLVLRFDRILHPCFSHHVLQGGWLRGLEECQASSVTVVSECGWPLRVRMPHPVVTFHVVTDDDLYLERPKGNKYEWQPYDGNIVPEADAVEILDLCILAAHTPQARIPNTRTRQLCSMSSLADEPERVCITGNASTDKHYKAVLKRWAPAYCTLANSNDVPSVDWYVSGHRWQKRGPFPIAW